jgi:hypothetical protein
VHTGGGSWKLQLDLDAGYHYDGAAEPFRLEANLRGSYDFTFEPAPALSGLAGGRNLGRLEGRILAGERAIAGVEIGIGPFRLISDADGHFEAELEPGSYRVRLAATTLPANVRLFGPSELVVEVPLHDRVLVGFDVRETASLLGRVLEDRDGDGAADLPEIGVQARLILLEADGVVRSLASDASGALNARGIAPGAVELRLFEQPFGSVSVGPAALNFDAAPGGQLEVTILSRPAQAAAQCSSVPSGK